MLLHAASINPSLAAHLPRHAFRSLDYLREHMPHLFSSCSVPFTRPPDAASLNDMSRVSEHVISHDDHDDDDNDDIGHIGHIGHVGHVGHVGHDTVGHVGNDTVGHVGHNVTNDVITDVTTDVTTDVMSVLVRVAEQLESVTDGKVADHVMRGARGDLGAIARRPLAGGKEKSGVVSGVISTITSSSSSTYVTFYI